MSFIRKRRKNKEEIEVVVTKHSEIIYHGSYIKIEFPEIRKHHFTKDFSWGFYCTKNQKQAEKWSEMFNTPLVNVYELKNVEELKVKEFKDYSDEWLEFVVDCRSGKTHEYDVVIGPMADDTIYDYIEAYSIGQMNKEKFFKLMNWSPHTRDFSRELGDFFFLSKMNTKRRKNG